MYINPFIAGILSTLFVECVALITFAIINIERSNRRK